nr:MAG TPA: hypothetical protein [Bacteriophage sp.]
MLSHFHEFNIELIKNAILQIIAFPMIQLIYSLDFKPFF